ncbi:MAG: phage holin family protein [Flavobacteriales bacterium]
MKFITKLIVTAIAVIILSYLLPGVEIVNYTYALLVALVLGLLNSFLKPILIFATLPATIITLGLFLLVINAGIILLADYFLSGFTVHSFWWALLFSILLSIVQSLLNSLFKKDKVKKTY